MYLLFATTHNTNVVGIVAPISGIVLSISEITGTDPDRAGMLTSTHRRTSSSYIECAYQSSKKISNNHQCGANTSYHSNWYDAVDWSVSGWNRCLVGHVFASHSDAIIYSGFSRDEYEKRWWLVLQIFAPTMFTENSPELNWIHLFIEL